MFEKSKLYHVLLFIIWNALQPFQSVLGFTVPEKAADIEPEISVREGITTITYSFPRLLDVKPKKPVTDYVDMLNAYLTDWYFPQFDTPIFTYMAQKYPTIYLKEIAYTKTAVQFSCVLVNNPLSVEYVKSSINQAFKPEI